MIRRADNVQIHFKPGWLTGRGWVTLYIGKQFHVRLGKQHKRNVAATVQQQRGHPVRVARVDQKTYWQFQDRFYWDNDDLDAAAVYALLVTRQQRQNQRIAHAQQIVAMGTPSRAPSVRGHIPDDVKHLVWTRDQGRCRHCGSTTELQFDHVIPVAMGGGSGPENLQVLCGPCNRRKGASVTLR
jgi:5-methylcytosine-specific restriction endonuclease McrA